MAKAKDRTEWWWASIEAGEPVLVQIHHFQGKPSIVFYFGNEVEDDLHRLDIRLIRRVREPRVSS